MTYRVQRKVIQRALDGLADVASFENSIASEKAQEGSFVIVNLEAEVVELRRVARAAKRAQAWIDFALKGTDHYDDPELVLLRKAVAKLP